jgi:DNA-binding MarR family transcriptional regulator
MKTEKDEEFFLDQSLGFVMHRALASVKAKVRFEFQRRGCDVTVDQWVILCALWEKDGVSHAQLTEKTYKDRPTVTRMIDLLEKKGFVYRKRSSIDKRIYRIYLTPKGKSFRSVLVPVVLDLHEVVLRGFSESEVELLYSLLDRVYKNTKK